jgi:rhodanese-related sulfurtransferase
VSEKIGYVRLHELLDEGAQLVEVLPADEYEEEHLPGAINIPLKELDADSTSKLDKSVPTIVYCWDYLCDMSPRAAARLDSLGFERVYDYAASKVDYLARGLPREGDKAQERRPIDVMRGDVVRCRLEDAADEVRGRIDASPHGFGLVVTEDQVVLGRVRRSVLEEVEGATAEDVMEPGPSTIRADKPIDAVRKRLEEGGFKVAIVTTPDGVLLGIVRGADL